MSLVVGAFMQPGPATMFAQIAGLLSPVLIHHYLGDYQARHSLYLPLKAKAVAISITLIGCYFNVLFLGCAAGALCPDTSKQEAELMEKIFQSIIDDGGIFFTADCLGDTGNLVKNFVPWQPVIGPAQRAGGEGRNHRLGDYFRPHAHGAPRAFYHRQSWAWCWRFWCCADPVDGGNCTSAITPLVILSATALQEAEVAQAEEALMSPNPAYTLLVLLVVLVIGVAIWALLRGLPAIPKD